MKNNFFKSLVACFILLQSCGGSGTSDSAVGGTDLDGLEIGEQVSLMMADTSASSNLSSLLQRVDASGTDYENDQTHTYVYDESINVFDFVNEIICYLDQTNYAGRGVVNAGPSQVFVDEGACNREADRSSEATNQSAGRNWQDFVLWTVDSTRADERSPQVVKIWVPNEEMGGEIRGKITITTAASVSNPFGEFEMYFSAEGMEGFIVISTTAGSLLEIQTKFEKFQTKFEKFDSDEWNQEAYGVIHYGYDSFGRTRMQSTTIRNNDSPGVTTTVTTESTYDELGRVSKSDDEESEETCKDRKNFKTYARDYHLYDSDFTRVELNAGMPIHVPGAGEHGFGWASYYGIWLPEDIELSNGMKITDDEETKEYTLFAAPGRLIRKTRQTLPLSDFIGEQFNTWKTDQTLRVELAEGEGDEILIMQVGVEACNRDGCELTDTEPTELTFNSYDGVGLWKDGFGFINVVASENGTFSGEQDVSTYEEEFVLPNDSLFDDGQVTFKCYYDCLEAPLDLSDGTPFFPFDGESGDPIPYYYTLSPDDFTLKYDGTNVAIELGSTELEETVYYWGVRSSSMVLSSTAVFFWETWAEDVTYEWETGPNSWNHTTLLLDTEGNPITFDRPLSCSYTHDTYGTYRLDYGGPGHLWGIPFAHSEEENSERWVPLFTVEGEVICDGDTYYAKPMVLEQVMQEADRSVCRDLSLDDDLGEMTASFKDPGIGDNPCNSRSCETR